MKLKLAWGWGKTLAEHEHDRENNYQLLRFIAAMAVVYGHSYALSLLRGGHDLVQRALGFTYSGDLAVEMFFVISGFLVTASYLHRDDLAVFAKARILRIFPALFVCLFVTVFIWGPLVSSVSVQEYFASPLTWKYLAYTAPLWKAQMELPGVFLGSPRPAMNGPLWTLPAEIRMYIVVALFGVAGILRRRWLANLALGALAVCLVLTPDLVPMLSIVKKFAHLALIFCVGMAFYINRDWVRLDWKILVLLFIFALVMRALGYFPLGWTVFFLYATMWLVYVPDFHWYNRVGDYSYGVYIYGWPVQETLVQWFPGLTPVELFFAAAAGTLPLAALSWHLVEQPALQLKQVPVRKMLGRFGEALVREFSKLDRFGSKD